MKPKALLIPPGGAAAKAAQRFVALIGVLTCLIGGLFFFFPGQAAELIKLVAKTAATKTEIRAMYGGLQLGIGAYLVLGARQAYVRGSLIAVAVMFAGLATGRIVGTAVDGWPGVPQLVMGLFELSLTGAALAIRWRVRVADKAELAELETPKELGEGLPATAGVKDVSEKVGA